MLTHKRGKAWIMPKKKNGRLARLGKQPLHPNYKNKGGECFCIQKLPPLIQKKEHEGLRFLLPQATFGCLLLSFLVLLFTPTSKYSILDVFSFPLVYFLHLLVLQIMRMCLYLWGSFGLSVFSIHFLWVGHLVSILLCLVLRIDGIFI